MSNSFQCEHVRILLEKEIQTLPDNFYDTFDYTETGNNLAHPITLGILCKVLSSLSGVCRVGIDVRLNMGNKQKFQPDIVVYGDTLDNSGIKLFVDYESPNSSDARIPEKDVKSYLEWSSATNTNIPYIIVTTLPNKRPQYWELRYTSEGYHNYDVRRHKNIIFKNPFLFWYNYYSNHQCLTHENIYFLNINSKTIDHVKDI